MNSEDIRNRFTYHKPDAAKAHSFEVIRALAHEFADLINRDVPEGREKSLAVTHIEEAVFWANAGSAREIPKENGS